MSGEDAMRWAEAAAADCGVTRIAELTGLDRIGVPVFHAVRPLSRSLCVHQGKGLTAADARLGALMEAVESGRAETFAATWGTSSWSDLPDALRPRDLGDFAVRRDEPIDDEAVLFWVEGRRLVDGAPRLAPFDGVSLDFARPRDRRLAQTSNGLGARFDFEGAVLKGLLEVIERDAASAWSRASWLERAQRTVDLATVGFDWLPDIRERLGRAEVRMTAFAMLGAAGLPVVHVHLLQRRAAPGCTVAVGGWGCDPHPERALQAALLEAVQCRLTAISATRDDILFDRPLGAGAAFPLPPGMRGVDWRRFAEPFSRRAPSSPGMIAERLADDGYPDAMAVAVGSPDHGVWVAKTLVPGLAANDRTRRPVQLRRAA